MDEYDKLKEPEQDLLMEETKAKELYISYEELKEDKEK